MLAKKDSIRLLSGRLEKFAKGEQKDAAYNAQLETSPEPNSRTQFAPVPSQVEDIVCSSRASFVFERPFMILNVK